MAITRVVVTPVLSLVVSPVFCCPRSDNLKSDDIGVVGAVAGLIVIGIAILYVTRRGRRNRYEANQPQFQFQEAPPRPQETSLTPPMEKSNVLRGPAVAQDPPFQAYVSRLFMSFGCGGGGEAEC